MVYPYIVAAIICASLFDPFLVARILSRHMYNQFFSLKQAPFSIAPDPRYLLMTQGHREALAHLLYGVNSGGGLVLLTGEIGAGKTTVCRGFLEMVPANCNVAYIFNPKLTVNELLQSICDEFGVKYKNKKDGKGAADATTVKDYVDALTDFLLAAHAEGQNNVLVIDEAQNLSADVLEQLRLLTNLETSERKLLQITLIGQPELRAMLDRPELKQLAQRVIARYHLKPLSEQETASYIQHRLAVAGLTTALPFQKRLMKQIHQLTHGIPRRINLLCDRALLGAYAEDKREVSRAIIRKAAAEVFGRKAITSRTWRRTGAIAATGMMASAAVAWAAAWTMTHDMSSMPFFFGTAASKTRPAAAVQNTAIPFAPDSAPSVSDASQPAVTQIISEHDGSSGIGWKNEDEAYRQLAGMWGALLPDNAPCLAARDNDLHCYKSSSGLAGLRQLDRPAILAMRDEAGNAYHVILTALVDSHATIQVGDARQTISMVVLARYFSGDFATFWRAPQSYRKDLQHGDRGPEVDWVAAQLAKLGGEPPPGENRLFDKNMVRRVREFQLAQGLNVDGVVGPATFMHFNRVAGYDEPRLTTGRSAGQTAIAK